MEERAQQLSGHRVLVTGGTRNIGKEVALSMARSGAAVAVLGGSDQARLDGVVEELRGLGVQADGRLADASDWDQVDSALTCLQDSFGPVDVVVNNVGVRPSVAIEDVDAEHWDYVMRVNVRCAFQCIQWALPAMEANRWGRVINVSGVDAVAGSYNRLPVTTSKAALMGLTAAIAPRCALSGITVNTVVPGAIDTYRHTPEWYPHMDKFVERALERIPMGRLGDVSEVASAVVFLSSDAASYMTGQSLVLAGGYPLLRRPEWEG